MAEAELHVTAPAGEYAEEEAEDAILGAAVDAGLVVGGGEEARIEVVVGKAEEEVAVDAVSGADEADLVGGGDEVRTEVVVGAEHVYLV